MLLEIKNTHESHGLSKLCDFSIQTNGVMIKALTSRLYSNPIASIVRELASNAADANSDVPMHITIPSQLDPRFVVTDHGPGLSEADMVNVFTKFGESTKRNTNTQIGGFGLGAKSPFAIVNSYTIVSRHGGIATTYIASIGTDGMPGLHRVSSESTSSSGLTIVVPATPDPKWEAALSQIAFFKPQPVITGCNYRYPKPLYECPSFIVMPKGEAAVLVGPVSYPLDIYKTGSGSLFNYNSPPFVLKFGIGEIEVTASREEIVYNKDTIALLSKRLREASQQYGKIIEDLLAKCRTAPEAWHILSSSIFNFNRTLNVGKAYTISPTSIWFDAKDSADYSCITSRNTNRRRWTVEWRCTIQINKDDLIFYMDDERKWQDRIRTYLDATPLRRGNSIILAKDRTDLDAVGLEYIPISALPCPSTRKSPVPRSFRIIDSKHKLRVTTEEYSFCLRLGEGNTFRGVQMTYPIYTAMVERVGNPFYLIPANFKGNLRGLDDIAPLWDEAFSRLTNLQCASDYFAFMNFTTPWNKYIYQILAELQKVPPIPHHVQDVEFVFTKGFVGSNLEDVKAFNLLPHPTHNYEEEYTNALNAYPTLKWVCQRTYASSDFKALHNLVSFIVKE